MTRALKGSSILLILLGVTLNCFAKEVIYHMIDPPYNPDYVGSTPDPNNANNYFYLRSAEPPDSYSYDINQQFYPIMRDQYFYRDYGDWSVGDYEDFNTANYGSW